MSNKEFKEEIEKPVDVDLKKLFYKVVKKKVVEAYIELRALFYRALLLSDDEKEVFKNELVYENMTEAEIKRYERTLPRHHFERYFPKKGLK